MKYHKLIAFSILILIFPVFVVSCGDDDEEQADPKAAKITLLTADSSKTWVVNSHKEEGVEITEECERDNEWTFTFDGAFTVDNKIKCSPDQVGTVSGSWKLNDDATVIILTDTDSETIEFTLIELTETILRVSFKLETIPAEFGFTAK